MNNEPEFERHAAGYDASLQRSTGWIQKDTSFFSEYKIRIIKNLLRTNPPRILDYGCGIGRNIPFLKKYFPGAAITGFDVSQASITIARAHYGYAEFCSSREELGAATFDLVVVSNVFHHIHPDEWVPSARHIATHCNDGAHVFCFEHNPYNPLTQYVVRRSELDANAILIPRKALENLFAKAGLLPFGGAYCLFVPCKSPLVEAFERMIGGIPLGAQYFIHFAKAR